MMKTPLSEDVSFTWIVGSDDPTTKDITAWEVR